jgi:uncharacterized repeat protein (TIGR01451 family)
MKFSSSTSEFVTRTPVRFVGAVVAVVATALALLATPGVAFATVPTASGNNAVITVKVGGDRTGASTVGPLAGVTLTLYDGTTTPGSPISTSVVPTPTCISDAQGDCSFTIPNTSNSSGTNANRDQRFWIVRTGTPAGYYANDSLTTGSLDGPWTATAYQFRTGDELRAGNTYTSTNDFMKVGGSTDANRSTGIWQVSRTNPTMTPTCGLRVALIMDLSTSVKPDIDDLKSAATTFVNSLVGTPSSMSLYTFGSSGPASGSHNTNIATLTNVSTQTDAAVINTKIDGLTIGNSSYTNWDRGIAQVAEASAQYDVAIIITDGNPTVAGTATTGDYSRFNEDENGIYSANELKAKGTRIVAVGVGAGISSGAANLKALSGPTLNTDYYQSDSYSAAGTALRALALGNCNGTISVVKEVVPWTADANTTTGAAVAGGWTFGSSTTVSGVSISPTSSNTNAVTGAVNYTVTYPNGSSTAAVTFNETQKTGYVLQKQGLLNASCKRLDTNAAVTVTDSGTTGFTVTSAKDYPISCLVYNREPTPVAHLTLTKVVDNGTTGATAAASSWTLSAAGPTTLSGVTGSAGVTNKVVTAGSYTLSESGGVAQYTPSTWSCTAGALTGAVLVLADTDTAVCTITNTANAPHLTLIKNVTNTHGGSAAATAWTLSAAASGLTTISGVTGTNAVTSASGQIGTYNLSESGGPTGYSASDWVCTGAASATATTVTLALGSSATCTITNTDQGATLTLKKTVVNGSTGATTLATAWTLSATGPTNISGVNGANSVTNAPVSIGSYALSESGGPTAYTASAWDCTGGTLTGATVSVAANASVVCTITNTAVAPTLTLVKTVDNGTTGATTLASAWTLTATGPTTISGITGVNATAKIGTYTLSESANPTGYTASDWSCLGAASSTATTVTLALGSNATCTIKNTIVAPTLTLIKTVVNGTTGSTAAASDWTLTATGPSTISGTTGVNAIAKVGVYTLGESNGPLGYTASNWVCTNGASATATTVTLSAGNNATCTITNTAEAPTLTLIKSVVNSHGGTSTVADWTLTATGSVTITGKTGAANVTGAPVTIGTYTLSEAGTGGYAASQWICSSAASTTANTVTLALGNHAICTITNSDQAATLTLVKAVDNGSTGATATATDWTLNANGPTPLSGTTGNAAVTNATVNIGSYALSESSGPAGYTASIWVCPGGTLVGSTVSVTSGANVTCTITNTASAPTLTLVKQVVNGTTGATAIPSAWTLTASGPTTIAGSSGAGTVSGAPVTVGTYTLGESGGPSGYIGSAWVCSGAAASTGTTVTVAAGNVATCTVTNTAVAASLTVVKALNGTRLGANDQFTVRIATSAGGNAINDTAHSTTQGAVSAITAGTGTTGTKAVTAGTTYYLGESASGDANLALYGQSLSCIDSNSVQTTLPSGALTANSSVIPVLGSALVCTITNTPASYTVAKSVDHAVARPGDVLTYSITVHNTGTVAYSEGSPASFLDDVSDVLDDAAYVAGSATNGAVYAAGQLSWSGPLAVGATLVVTYQVTVAGGGTLHLINTVSTPTGIGAGCAPAPATCTTDTPVQLLVVGKTVDKASALPGDVVTYTITVHNTGSAPYTVDKPASFSDDLSAAVLPYATWVGWVGAPASGAQSYSAPMVSWSGELGSGASITVTYSVKVRADIDTSDTTLRNVVVTPAELQANCPSGSTDPACTVTTVTRSFTVVKTASTTQANAGDVVTYTITLHNNGMVPYTVSSPASLNDDLTGVLDDATYNNDATGGAIYTAPNLVWSGTLDVDETKVITYSVTVKIPLPDAGNRMMTNIVTTPPGSGGDCPVSQPTAAHCIVNTPVETPPVIENPAPPTTTPPTTTPPTTTPPTTLSPVSTPPTTSPAAPATVSATALASTGSQAMRQTAIAVAVIALGVVFLMIGRRRRRS